MAQNIKVTGTYQEITVSAPDGGVYELGDGADSDVVCTLHVHLIPVGLTGGAITVKARTRGTDAETNLNNGGVPVPYVKSYLNGAVGDDSMVSTVITSESMILIPASGRVPILSIASGGTGKWRVYVRRVIGVA